MRLINADVLETHTHWECFDNPDDDYEYVLKIDIDNAPTIEAEPIKHGHWIVISEYPKKAECSYCGYPIEHELVCWWGYCPNCGARMDEVEE